jgi:outer membrane protein assembly factor BamA
VSADQRWRTKGLQIVYGYRFEREHTVDPRTANDAIPLDVVTNLAKLSEAIVWDRRDDPINSRKGHLQLVSFDQSAAFLGSDRQNRKLLMQQFVFVPLGKLVLASRVQAASRTAAMHWRFSDRSAPAARRACAATAKEGLGERERTAYRSAAIA